MFLEKEDIDRKALEIENLLHIMKEDKRFTYDDPTHTYRWEGKFVPSVSSFIKRLTYPFDQHKFSKKKALELGISQEEVLEMWDENRNSACADGHEVHTFAEHDMLGSNPPLPPDGRPLKLVLEYLDLRKERLKNIRCLGAEVRMYSKTLNLAGTADLLLQNTETGEIILGDWKTNKSFRTYGGFNKLNWPLNNLYENELTKYSIQLTLYRMMLKENGISANSSLIIHIASDSGKSSFHKPLDLEPLITKYLKSFGPL